MVPIVSCSRTDQTSNSPRYTTLRMERYVCICRESARVLITFLQAIIGMGADAEDLAAPPKWVEKFLESE